MPIYKHPVSQQSSHKLNLVSNPTFLKAPQSASPFYLVNSELSLVLRSTPHFSWFRLPWTCHSMPPRQAASPLRPTTHYIPQCYAIWPHEQAAATYEPTLCGGSPSLSRHISSYVYPATPRAPHPRAPCQAPCPHPLEYLLMAVLVHGELCGTRDAEPSVMPLGWPRQSYVRHATSRTRASHTLLVRQPRRSHTYSCSKNCPNVLPFWKDWLGINQVNYQILWK